MKRALCFALGLLAGGCGPSGVPFTQFGEGEGPQEERAAPNPGPSPEEEPPPAPRPPDAGAYRCTPSGISASQYSTFFDALGRPRSDADMGWQDRTELLAQMMSVVRFPHPPAAAYATPDTLRALVNFLPRDHGDDPRPNLELFRAEGLTDADESWVRFNPRHPIPASMTRYGMQLSKQRYANFSHHEWTEAALRRLRLACPDCPVAGGIVTLSGVPTDAEDGQHDFFKIFDVQAITARDVTAGTERARALPSGGRLYLSKPFKMIAAVDASAALSQHIRTELRPFGSADGAFSNTALRYRGELPDDFYNVIQSGTERGGLSGRTGAAAVLIRYAAENDVPLRDVCEPLPGDDPCGLGKLDRWRCGPHGPNGRDALQVCRRDRSSSEGYAWLTDSFRDCARCQLDPARGCTR